MAERSKTVDAALNLLVALRDNHGDATTAELARRHNLSRTATARLLATLEAHDLATRTPAGWTLGRGLLGLARHVPGAPDRAGRGGAGDTRRGNGDGERTPETPSATGDGHAPLPTGR
jgi:hypothetical protein